MKNTNLLALLEAAASLQEPGESAPEFENLGHELAQKLKGGQLTEGTLLNGVCQNDPGPCNTSCGKN
jgi:hypothetical protein